MMYLVLPPDLYTTPWHGRDSKKLNFQVRVWHFRFYQL
jgi:hypothetical protein